MKNLLLIIDPQNDFTDPKGSLYVPGAPEAIGKIAKFIRTQGNELDGILISQDTHQKYNIGFPSFWNIPCLKEFDKIVVEDIVNEKVKPYYIDPSRKDAFLRQFTHYREKELTVWPYHCIEGTWGWCFPKELTDALGEWNLKYSKKYMVFQKGNIPEIEAYSIFPSIPNIGEEMIPRPLEIFKYHNIYISGFCKDICVSECTRGLKNIGSANLIILDNCMATLDPKSPNISVYEGLKIENA